MNSTKCHWICAALVVCPVAVLAQVNSTPPASDTLLATLSPLFIVILALCGFLFWLWMLIDCVTKESNQGNNRLVWVVIIIFTNIIDTLIYWVVRRPQRNAELGR